MRRFTVLLLIVIIISSCDKNGKKELAIDEEVLIEVASNQLQNSYILNEETSNLKGRVFPRTITESNKIKLVNKKDWTSGFFPGVLWLMYGLTEVSNWKEKAISYTEVLESEKFNSSNHDLGFKMMPSFGLAYEYTKNEKYKDVLIQSAKTLATRFDENVGCIRSWNHHKDKWEYPVIIDNLINLELLFWASKETGDSVFYNIADTHAKTTMKNHFRDDYSSYHVVGYDSETGAVLSKNTHQGYATESSWTRGQGWALYGYTMIYRETKNPMYLKQAENVANYIINVADLQEDYIPLWDLSLKDIEKEPRDTSAAAVIASALYELSTYTQSNTQEYLGVANNIMRSLSSDNYYNNSENSNGFLLKHATGSKPTDSEIDVPLIYGDYYYLEALSRKIKLNKTKLN